MLLLGHIQYLGGRSEMTIYIAFTGSWSHTQNWFSASEKINIYDLYT